MGLKKGDSEFWGLLHDGEIQAIRGDIPGDVSIDVSIRYLRQQFPGEGVGFRVDLADCQELEYREYDSQPVSRFETIVALQPAIVGAELGVRPVVVTCVTGILTLSYEAASVFLDSG